MNLEKKNVLDGYDLFVFRLEVAGTEPRLGGGKA